MAQFTIQGEAMANSAMAKQAVAMKACIMLHKVRQGGLDDNLSPVESDSESESEDESDSPAQPKIGTRKRKRLHIVGTSKQLYGRLTTDGSENVYVYAINMKLDEVSSTVKKSLWDRKRVLFGIITNGELPELPPFSLYNDIGKLTVVLERCQLAQSEVVLTRNQRDLIDWFHEFTFIETLQFKFESLTRNGCRVVLLNYDGSSVTSNEPTVHGSVASGGINFNEMGLLKRKNALESDGRFSCNTDLLDSVVIKAYLPQSNPDPRHYMVTSTDGNPSSEFPDPDKAKTFKEYYERNYDIKIMDLSQPLVEVIPHSRDIDCRSGKGKSDKPKERLIPELLKFRTSSQSLTLRALLLPTILYRINSLVSMSQLQDSVVREITNASCIDNTPEPPAKRLKLLTLSSVKERNSNDTTMVEPFQSLSKYFYPFDNSKSVPLLQLLEAMTCASSRDNFDLERLEMLGDSFLKIAVSVHVYWHKNHKDEGKLTKYRTRQISNKKLFELANKRQLPKYIKHSVFSKQTWFPPGFTSPQSKVENGNSSCCGDHDFDVSTHDVIHDDVVHDNAMQDDAAGDAMCEEGSEDVVYSGATGDVIHDDAMHEDASDNVVNKNVTNNVMNNDFDSYYVMRQEIPDKSVADSMEALIGAHLVHCGYMGALRFMTWLGLDVFHSENTENRKLTNNYRRRKSSQCKSKYANYPLPTLDIPADESNERYEQLLDEHTKEMASFEEKIGYTFKNKVLLLEAFTHPTYYDNTITGSYQRLEFLGDAILDFLVTQHIYNKCETNLKPGDLTDLRSALVNNNIFAVIAVENDYHKYLKEYSPHLFTTMGHFVTVAREHQQNLGDKVIPDPYVIAVESDSSDVQCIEAPKPLGDVFESVAGAIFLDSGLDIFEVWRVCYPMLHKYIDEYSKKVPKNLVRRVEESDSKAEFSSANIMKNGRVSCVLTFNGQKYDGVGRNKRNAKLSAAYKALHNI